ncbi:MAG: BREX-6 system phosphatase PglZ [Polyangiales bacterium]
MTSVTPVSDALLRELRATLRAHGLVVWCDPHNLWRSLSQRLLCDVEHLGSPMIAFGGSWLAWLDLLGERPQGRDRSPLLLYLPGLDDAALRESPAFPLVQMGHRFEPDVAAVLRNAAAGEVPPDRTEAFLRAAPPSLAAADAWLASERAQRDARREALYARFSPEVLLDDLLSLAAGEPPKMHGAAFESEADVTALAEHLHTVLGMPPAWRAFCAALRGPARRPAGDSADAVKVLRDRVTDDLVAWILSVEYVRDLQREPRLAELTPLRTLPEALAARCQGLAVHLRQHHAKRYASLADEVELLLRDGELHDLRADDLGQIDTFRCEEQAILSDAVRALQASRWQAVIDLAEARLAPGRSYWLAQEDADWSRLRRWAWTLVRHAARLGKELAAATHDELRSMSLGECAEHYASRLAAADRAHRTFEQRLAELLDPRMEHYGALQEVATRLRGLYRAWADGLARAFSARCRDRGFLPDASYQQRTLYDQVVQPLVESGRKVALFLVDAFRYEMATELVDLLAHDDRALDLRPRLAELPTLTAVGMNALAPVAQNGKLRVAGEFEGFRAGEFTVARPDDRARAVGQRSLGKTKALLLDLAAVCGASPGKDLAKQVAQRQVIVVQSREIDDAGEANVGVRAFEGTLRDLAAAWHLLNAAGVEVCVFTADHGFLLQDATTHVQPFGTKRDPKRRYVLDPHPRAEPGMVNVAASALGYEGLDGYLLFREDTAVFATGAAGASFVHGGNSLQERVIPVLVVEAKRARAVTEQRYRVVARAESPLVGLHRVSVQVVHAETQEPRALLEEAAPVMGVAIRVVGRDDVQVTLRDVDGTATLRSGRVQLAVGGAESKVLFALEGPRDERVQIELYHPDNPRLVGACVPAQLFDVAGVVRAPEPSGRGPQQKPSSPRIAALSSAWSEAIEDEGARKVFLHLEAHGAITEAEATKMLGTARAFRRFSGEFERYVPVVPFQVHVEASADGKRYVKDGDK